MIYSKLSDCFYDDLDDKVALCMKKAKEILSSDIESLHRTAQLLIEREKVSGDVFRACLNKTGEFAEVVVDDENVTEIKEE